MSWNTRAGRSARGGPRGRASIEGGNASRTWGGGGGLDHQMTMRCTGVVLNIAIITDFRTVMGVNDVAEIDILATAAVFVTSREFVKRTCLALSFGGGDSVSL